MLVNRPEDRPKVIGLSITVTLAMGYFMLFTMPKVFARQHHATPDASQLPAVPAAPPMAAVTEENFPPKSGVNLYTETRSPAESVPDPFTPPALPPGAAADTAPGKGGAKQAAPVTAVAAPVTPGPVQASASAAQASAPGKQAAAVAPPALPSFTLQGIIYGEQAVGVFLIGDQPYYRHAGELVAAGLYLAKITEAGVVLKQGQNYMMLEIGHNSLSPITKATAQAAVSIDATSRSLAPPNYF